MRLICGGGELCQFHEDGGPPEDACPGMCDADGCRAPGPWELTDAPVPLPDSPAHYCTGHLVQLISRSFA